MRFNKLIIPALIILAILTGGCFQSRRGNLTPNQMERYARGTLESIAFNQLTLRQLSPENSFGTFEELQSNRYFTQANSLDNMIPGYTIDWQCSSSTSRGRQIRQITDVEIEEGEVVMEDRISITNEITSHEPYDSFTIIAYPSVRVDELRTFAVRDDMVIRVYNPDGGDEENMISSWDAVE